MNEFKRINEPRVEKMIAFIGHVLTSAKSQRATREEIVDLLSPVGDKLMEVGWLPLSDPLPPTPPPPPEPDKVDPGPAWLLDVAVEGVKPRHNDAPVEPWAILAREAGFAPLDMGEIEVLAFRAAAKKIKEATS